MPQPREAYNQYGGLDQDMNAKDPKRDQFYFDAQNITIVFNRELSRNIISNERGNKLMMSLPNVLLNSNPTILVNATATSYVEAVGDFNSGSDDHIQRLLPGSQFDTSWYSGTTAITSQTILGGSFIKDDIYIISTDTAGAGHLFVWKINYDTDFTTVVSLVYFGPTANMSDANLITKIFGLYESETVQKLYWVDNGQNQMRILNVAGSNLLNLPVKTIDATPAWDFITPEVTITDGGGGEWSVGAGTVQYGYRLYTKHGPATRMSPLSLPAAITKDNHGVPSGEKGTCVFTLEMSSIDQAFEYIEVYRFTRDDAVARNTTAHIIYEGLIESSSFKLKDRGDFTNIALEGDIENLLTTPGGPYFPKTLEFKDNRVFIGNVSTQAVTFDYDARAYQFIAAGEVQLVDTNGSNEYLIDISDPTKQYPTDETLDTINAGLYTDPKDATYQLNKFQSNGTTLGAEGLNVSINYSVQDIATDNFKAGHKIKDAGYKRGEIYRFGVQFFDKWGNALFVKWIGDIRMPVLQDMISLSLDLYDGSNMKNLYPRFTFDNLDTLPDNVYSFRIVRAETNHENRYIKSQGILNPTFYLYSGAGNEDYRKTYMPMYMLRHIINGSAQDAGNWLKTDLRATAQNTELGGSNTGEALINRDFLNFYCPERSYASSLLSATDTDSIHVIAGARISATGYFKSALDDDSGSYIALADWTDLFNADEPYSSTASSWFDAFAYAHAGVERYHWVLNQGASNVGTGTGLSPSDVFFPAYEIAATSATSGTTPSIFAGTQYRNYIYAPGAFSASPADLLILRANSTNGYLLDCRGDFVTEVTGNQAVIIAADTREHYVVAQIWNDISNITYYGGNGYLNRQNTAYIACSETQEIGASTQVINMRAYNGDCFPALYKFLLMDYDVVNNSSGDPLNFDPEFLTHTDYSTPVYTNPGTTDISGSVTNIQSSKTFVEIPIESYINLALVSGENKFEQHKTPTETKELIPPYNNVYHTQDNFLKYYVKPFSFTEIDNNGILTRYSDTNVNNSYIDGHAIFRAGNQSTVDALFGNITAFHIFNDTLFVVQEYGSGYWSVSPNATVSTAAGQQTSLGRGDILHNYTIVSDKYGSRYPFGSIVGAKGVYVLDYSKKKFLRISQNDDPVSDYKGIHSLLLKLPKTIEDDLYNNGTGVRLGYDPLTYNVYISILHDGTGGLIDGGSGTPAPFESDNPVS